MERVVIGRCDTYEVDKLKEFFHKGFKEIDFNGTRSKVLLKPNLLSGKPPEKAVNTHPEFIRALAEILLDYSCDVYIGDSPGYESAEKVFKNSGIMDIVESIGLKVSHFDRKIVKQWQGISPYREFIFGEDPDYYDIVINLPKLKTHEMMGLTLGVKNTFGFIRSFDKAKWHLKAGRDRMLFASILIDIHNIVKPELTILDGVVGMDGNGPSNGRARNIGVIALSRDAFVLDYCIEGLINVPSPLPLSLKAKSKGLIKEYEIVAYGMPIVISDFQMPKTIDVDWNLPAFAKNILRNMFLKKPKLDNGKCKDCGVCIDVCPAEALSFFEEAPRFDYKKCIRCYCCQEMCPEGAIRI